MTKIIAWKGFSAEYVSFFQLRQKVPLFHYIQETSFNRQGNDNREIKEM